MDVVVVGGGLAGLVCARHLAREGADVTLFEREPAVGGRVRSRHEGGYTFDRGFQVLFTAYPAAKRELDYDALDLRYFTPGACLARPGRRSVLSDPLRDPGLLAESALNREVTLGDKLRTLALRRRLSNVDPEELFSGGDQTIRAALLERGFSEDFIEHFAAPFYGGITLDRALSSSAATFAYTFAMLSRGRIAVPAAGMGEIPEQLADAARGAGATIETDSEVDSIDGTTVSRGGESVSADAVVVATDPKRARELTGVDSIPTEARGCLTQWYSLSEPLDCGKRLLLNVADDAPNHVVPHTAVAPEYAPEDETLLSATFLGEPDGSDEDLTARTREALASWFPERSVDSLSLLHTDRLPFSQFAQPPGFYRDLPDVRDPEGPVYLAGESTQWSSIQGAIESGRVAAEAVLEDSA
ncbi:NAD(P)/FAD-dependent oxidoreductase [Halalkalicoccus jeotgali]|uniref:Flavin-containing amine-oxidoreductase n=1 Tax=Halalkalicoccus jeotgali (strain DSM 18796 / CECT 7217 / JCM 14584 / KCTC 4019 / B3) TaxID=795797 RepID=D8J685_HALJB|nr:NAD(P)/FAD-dependent oxidoreductase [Halalkalicoccus jeotgali]ADJ15803.1 flavin-containing amine-oxidoreductase [Halalkalicoccus jeotgali B3]ELY37173.1 flavin-containing amine-oxidoreductase [Halalkalicoccus jeotgali B3]